MRKIFINDFDRLRSGWRVLVFSCAFTAALLLLVSVLRVVYLAYLALAPVAPPSRFVPDMIYRISLLTAALGAGYLCVRFLEGLPWRSLGLILHEGWFRDLLIGSVMGFVALALGVGIATLGNGINLSVNNAPALSLLRSMLGSAVLLIVAALAEEAIFRGYPLQTFARAQLVSLGLAVTSIAFALAHLGNPNVIPGGTIINTVLAGLWLAVAYMRTRSLWLPLGLHWSWNWALGWFFGIPISGANLVSSPLLKAIDQGPEWFTGGSYGIEGGLAGTIALIVATVFVWLAPWLKATPELKKLTSEETPAIPGSVVRIRSVEE